MRVVDLNIGGCSNGQPRNQSGALAWIGRFLRDQDADVLSLQEVYNLNVLSGFRGNQAEKLQPLVGYPHKFWHAGGTITRWGVKIGTGGDVIFSKRPILATDYVSGVLRVTIAEDGGRVHVSSVHYPHPDADKLQMANVAVRMMDALDRNDRIIFTGDFNAGPDHPAWLRVRNGGGLQNTFDPAKGHVWCGADSAGEVHDQIDWILTRGFQTTRYRCVVDPAPQWTDHTAVIVDLEPVPFTPEPAECDSLRADFRRRRSELETLQRRLGEVMHHKPIDQDAAADLREQIKAKEAEVARIHDRITEIGCYDVPL